ncbi:MAG: hypothetical protein QOI95_4397 [Acidimicrobiaceae bacterium]|jgi:hypothetical protein
MKISNSAHKSRPWRIHEIVGDFRLEDVWELPGALGPADFPRLVELLAAIDPLHSESVVVRALFAVRSKLGELLGLDDAAGGVGSRVSTLRDRLPADLCEGTSGPDFSAVPFASLYLTDDEWAAESANRTMHGLIHVGRVPDRNGGYRAQLAIYVKPNGLLGNAYMATIRPFRYTLVYPLMFDELGRQWQAVVGSSSSLGVPA